ncbi:MAG TPA: ROK family protein [Spirochaetia bacterium]|nr:ROK family protein [Spirochaetia bacterium]
MNDDRKYLIGFDLGGTKMLGCLLTRDFEIVARNKEKIRDGSNGEEVFDRLTKCITTLVESFGIKMDEVAGAGVAVPSPIDLATGVVLETPNLGFRDFPLKARLEESLGIPVILENDVNAGTYGELRRGAAVGYRHVIGLFPGTGIGGGIVIDGKLYRGATGGAGEIGHMIIQLDGPLCGAGHYGCLESVASKTAMAKDAAMLATTGGAPVMASLAGGDVSKMKSSVFAKSIEGGDTGIARLLERAAYFLGIGLANCVNIFNPEAIIVGGGLVERFGDAYLSVAERSMRENAMQSLAKVVKLLPAKLGDDAVAIGVSSLLAEALANKT